MVGFKCICCSTEIKTLHEAKDPERSSYDSAVVDVFCANYGSKHDSDKFLFAICDTCIDKKKSAGIIVNKENPVDDIHIYDMKVYKDGGSILLETSIGDLLIDGRINTKTKGFIFKNNQYETPLVNQYEIKKSLIEPLRKFTNNRDCLYKDKARILILEYIYL